MRAGRQEGQGLGQVGAVLAEADPAAQEDLQMEAQVDHLAGEQTWPTEEEVS